MMRWKQIGAVALLAAMSASTALMQDATATPLMVPFPEVVVYEPETGALYNVTADGIQSGANLSDVPAFVGQTGFNYMLSPDRTKLFFAMSQMVEDNVSTTALYSADVASGACCEAFDPQNPQVNVFIGGLFSPDGSQFAASYFSPVFDPIVAGQVVVYDIATREIVARLDGSRLDLSAFNGNAQPGILMSHWTDQGIVLVPSCVGCEPTLDGLAQVWNPADDSLSEANFPYSLLDTRLATGETLRAAFDPTFPNNPDAVGMLPIANVVMYAPAPADLTTPATPQVIFFNPNNIYINRAQWVADGQAVFIHQADQAEWFMQSDEAYVLLRDGTQIPLTIPLTRTFLAATSDGWVMTDQQTRQYIYYRLSGATVEEIVLDAAYAENSYPVVVEQPKFGSSVPVGAAFPTVTAP